MCVCVCVCVRGGGGGGGEQRTRDRKVRGSSPVGATGSFSSPGSTFCVNSYFGIRSTHVLPQ